MPVFYIQNVSGDAVHVADYFIAHITQTINRGELIALDFNRLSESHPKPLIERILNGIVLRVGISKFHQSVRECHGRPEHHAIVQAWMTRQGEKFAQPESAPENPSSLTRLSALAAKQGCSTDVMFSYLLDVAEALQAGKSKGLAIGIYQHNPEKRRQHILKQITL